jgi:hypothetical protein
MRSAFKSRINSTVHFVVGHFQSQTVISTSILGNKPDPSDVAVWLDDDLAEIGARFHDGVGHCSVSLTDTDPCMSTSALDMVLAI